MPTKKPQAQDTPQEDESLNVGDVVWLRSGSPAMTVGRLPVGGSQAELVFWHGSGFHESAVPIVALTKTKPEIGSDLDE